ncbi:hypothetical protein [Micromonospora sp. NPDC004704]
MQVTTKTTDQDTARTEKLARRIGAVYRTLPDTDSERGRRLLGMYENLTAKLGYDPLA